MKTRDSRFWDQLWRCYPRAPSVALCRVPELEYAARLDVRGKVLDHCCGDGLFASLAWSGQRLSAGCDIDARSIEQARRRESHVRLDVCDVSGRLPYPDASFDLVFNNSALEHVMDLEAALAEVARVLSPGGMFAFSLLNHRYFEWWPGDQASERRYRQWHPFFHALDLEKWGQRLGSVGLRVISVEGYFDREASRELASVDYEFSGTYLAGRPSTLVRWYFRCAPLARAYWRWRLGRLGWRTEPDSGAGYFIRAVRAGEESNLGGAL